MVYLFTFTWWQHRFDTTMVNTQTHGQTNKLLLTGYTISSAT